MVDYIQLPVKQSNELSEYVYTDVLYWVNVRFLLGITVNGFSHGQITGENETTHHVDLVFM